MSKEEKKIINDIVDRIDERIQNLKEEYKKSYQYKSSGKYKLQHQNHINILIERRNTLVSVLNYYYTYDIRNLEELINE